MQQATVDAPAAPTRPRARTRVTWAVLAVVLGIHAAAAVAQPVLAGVYLNGELEAMGYHGTIGSSLVVVTMIGMAPAALLFWLVGKGPWWYTIAAVVLFFAEGLQIGMGYSRQFALHIPLGVFIVGAAVAMFWTLVAWRIRVGRQYRRART